MSHKTGKIILQTEMIFSVQEPTFKRSNHEDIGINNQQQIRMIFYYG